MMGTNEGVMVCRERAAEARAQAAKSTTEEVRHSWLDVAREWDEKAEKLLQAGAEPREQGSAGR